MEKIIARLQQTHNNLIETVNPLDDQLFNRRPSEGEWSIGEIIYHISLVEEQVTKYLVKSMEKPNPLGTIARMLQAPPWLVGLRLTKVKAPKFVEPLNPPARGDNMANYARVRKELKQMIDQKGRENLLNVTFKHPVLGNFDGTKTIEFLGYHELRHFKQINETLTKLRN